MINLIDMEIKNKFKFNYNTKGPLRKIYIYKTNYAYSSVRFKRAYSTRLTNDQKNSFSVPPHLGEVIVGSSLGDLHIRKHHLNALLEFGQSLKHEEYLLHLYDLFQEFCISPPRVSNPKPDFRTGKVYSRIRFYTLSLPCFNYYHELFYENGTKKIPLNIGDLLTPKSLAYWLMDDSFKHSSGLSICTESYSEQEVLLLISILKEKFNLECNPMKRSLNKYRIYVRSSSLNNLKSLVSDYFVPSMKYKIRE